VFLNSSDYNNITENEIYDNGGNPIGSGICIDPAKHNVIQDNVIYNNSLHGVLLIENTNITISGNEIASNGQHGIRANNSVGLNFTNNCIHNNTGDGISVDPSSYGIFYSNLIYGNGDYGIFLLSSSNMYISFNVILNNDLYAIRISSYSDDNTISCNDLIGNNLGGTSQVYDDGSNNLYTYNFFMDQDTTDSNNDGIVDNPYPIDGSQVNSDSTPSATPNQDHDELGLVVEDLVAYIEFYPGIFNLKSKDPYVTVYITLPEGYAATNINVSTVHMDGNIYAVSAKVKELRRLKVKFDRQELIAYLKSLHLPTPYTVNINVTGLLKGQLVRFNGSVEITVIGHKKEIDQLSSGFTPTIQLSSMLVMSQFRREFSINRTIE
jgi:parallel beta-helix repeat protein